MTDAPAPRRSSFWLIASLCLNFFLIGVIVTGLLVARNRMIANAVQGEGGGGLAPEIVLQMLPRSGALKMCGVLDANTEAFKRLGRDLVDARREMFSNFRADPFDAAAFKTSLDRLTRAQIALVELRQTLIADVTSKLDAQERAEFSRRAVRRFFGRDNVQKGQATLRELCAGFANAP